MSAVYTFSDLRNQVLANLDESGSTGTTLTLVNQFLNQAHQLRLGMQPWKFLEWDTAETFSLTVGQRVYPLHQEFWRPIYFFNQATNAYLIETPNRMLADTQARWDDTQAHPLYFRMTSRTPVQYQPSAASQISIVSSSVADTAMTQTVTIKGVTPNGVTTEVLQVSGTSPVTTTNTFTKILDVTKSGNWTGNLTLTSNAGAITNLFLFPIETGRSYQQLEFLVQPIATDVIEYKFIRQPTLLVNDADIPDIPFPHSQILVWDTLLLFSGYLTEMSATAIQSWTDMRNRLEIELAEAFLEGQSLENQPKYIRYIETDGAAPRIYT